MTFPQLSKNWTISPNVRQAYTTLVGVAGWYAYQNKTALLARGWTVKFTCDGTTGPSSPSDTTDRITSAANFATRGTTQTAAQSFWVLQNADGVQLMMAYQAAGTSPTGDDIIRISFSPGGLFVPGSPANSQPTATDEILVSAATTIIDPTASLDRVMSIFCADDTTSWRCALFRNSTVISCLSVGKTARIAPVSTFPVPYVGGKFTDLSRTLTNTNAGNTPTHWNGPLSTVGTLAARGFLASVFTASVTRVNRLFGISALGHTTTTYGSTNQSTDASTMASTFVASMGGIGALCWPIILWGEETVNLDGPWCSLVDWTQMVTTSVASPALGNFVPGLDFGDNPNIDPARTNWFVAIGAAAVWPWKNAAPTLEIV
jgi:hypothetical protein